MTFSELAAGWLETWAVRNGTRKRYAQAVREANKVFGSKPISEITRSDAELLVRRLKKGRSPATVSRLLAGLSACFAAAVDAGEIPHSPLQNRSMLLRRTGIEAARDMVEQTLDACSTLHPTTPARCC